MRGFTSDMTRRALVVVHPAALLSVRWIAIATAQGRVAHAVTTVFEMTGEATQKARIRIGHDREVVPAKAILELPLLADALSRAQEACDRVVVAVRVRDRHPAGNAAEVDDVQDDRVVVDVVAGLDAEVRRGVGGNRTPECSEESIRPEGGKVVLALRRRP